MNYRNKTLLRLARHSPCQRCGKPEGQGDVVAAHIQGFRAMACGKGTGIKPDDCATAFLCYDCHTTMDQYRLFENSDQYSEEWLWLIVKTHHWLLMNGHMEIRE